MDVTFSCPICHKLLALDESCLNRQIQCPYCYNIFKADASPRHQIVRKIQNTVESVEASSDDDKGSDSVKSSRIPDCSQNVSGTDSSAVFQRRILSCALTLIFAVVALLWIGGCVAGCSDASEGQNLIGYTMRKNSMNFISGSGYAFYFTHFTDIKRKRRELNEALGGAW